MPDVTAKLDQRGVAMILPGLASSELVQLRHDLTRRELIEPGLLPGIVLRALDRSPQFLAACLPRKVFPPRINRYSRGANYYGKHVDGAIRFTEGGMRVRTDVSCTVFLSDPTEYDGGELAVYEAGTTRHVKLPSGHAVLYPASHVHEVTPVTRGARMAAFFWVESMVRADAQRQLLHEFDLALTQLRESAGDSDTTVALVGTYHNLLRMWAET